ncbi:sterol desaturase family protein [Sphingomonas sp. QA11]|uniref:sterol desaturase family protein n=1 Tax=Sphingomonas sp. QA11 TaxID=2950605 RepID=UPI00234B41A7|nr:sterol desaturase family protein [Sphingomonas sp. QA11]WCM27409.1 sterol desaturase family protein [Sphingomonas sp. QA11]
MTAVPRSQRSAWCWATHSVHHSAEQMTLLASLRLGWTSLFSAGWLIYIPLVLLGLPPFVLVTLLMLNLRYQFFLHTEAVGRRGPLEWIFNTPAHHRLHHASNNAYIDRNYWGVLILFDRLFGTLAIERLDVAICYGLSQRRPAQNRVRLAFREWVGIFAEVFAVRTAGGIARALFSPPGILRDPR